MGDNMCPQKGAPDVVVVRCTQCFDIGCTEAKRSSVQRWWYKDVGKSNLAKM